MTFRAFISACLVMLSSIILNAWAGDAPGSPQYKIVAYYIAWGPERKYTPLDINGALITHLNYAFADIRHGEVAVADPDKEIRVWHNFAKLRQLKKAHPRLKTLISVGGWTHSKEFSNVALTPASRTKFANSAVAFIRKYGFDGVDIDWEYPVSDGDPGNVKRPEDKRNYTLLLQALRSRLDSAGLEDHASYLLSTAISTVPSFLDNTEMDKVARIVDYVNIMTYDFSGHWNAYAGHLAPLYADPAIARKDLPHQSSVSSAIDQTIDAGVPPEKLVMGMPFYGYSWKDCRSENHGQNQDCGGKGSGTWEDGTLTYSDIADRLVNKNGFVRYWNDVTKTPYLFNSQTKEFITYDDEESIAEKVKFLQANQLGGAMFWEITGDRKFALQKELAVALKGNTTRKSGNALISRYGPP